jgi:hypothetical protein
MWNDGSGFEHFLTDPWAAHPVVNPKTVCFKGGDGGSGNDHTYYDNIARDERNALANRERQREEEERALRELDAQKARDAEEARQNKIRGYETDINGRFDSMFTPDFYAKQENDYRNLYKPQLEDQFAKSQKDLTYWLADRGTLNSSVRGEKSADLTKLFDSGTRKINDSALSLSQQTKNNVANARSSLISDARNANPVDEPTVSSTMTALAAPQAGFSPPVPTSGGSDNTFADMFGSFTSALGKQAALERASAYSGGMIKPAFNTGLFGGNSVRLIS